MNRFAAFLVAALATFSVVPVGTAASQGNTRSVRTLQLSEIVSYHDKLARELETSKYKHVTNSSRDRIAAAQETIKSTVADKRSMEDLAPGARSSVYDAHADVLAILQDAELDRVICKKRHQIGSNRPKLECQTKRESMDAASRQQPRMRNCPAGNICS